MPAVWRGGTFCWISPHCSLLLVCVYWHPALLQFAFYVVGFWVLILQPKISKLQICLALKLIWFHEVSADHSIAAQLSSPCDVNPFQHVICHHAMFFPSLNSYGWKMLWEYSAWDMQSWSCTNQESQDFTPQVWCASLMIKSALCV